MVHEFVLLLISTLIVGGVLYVIQLLPINEIVKRIATVIAVVGFAIYWLLGVFLAKEI